MRALLLFALAACVPDMTAARKHLRSAIEDSQDDLNKCYAKALAKDPDTTGNLEVTLHVAQNGTVDESKVGTADLEDAKITKCVTDILEQVVVKPAPDGEFSIDYTFQLGEDSEPAKPKKAKKPKPKKEDEDTGGDDG